MPSVSGKSRSRREHCEAKSECKDHGKLCHVPLHRLFSGDTCLTFKGAESTRMGKHRMCQLARRWERGSETVISEGNRQVGVVGHPRGAREAESQGETGVGGGGGKISVNSVAWNAQGSTVRGSQNGCLWGDVGEGPGGCGASGLVQSLLTWRTWAIQWAMRSMRCSRFTGLLT